MAEKAKIGAYPYYVLAVLFVGTLLNYYDRNVIAIILQPMKADLHLNDTQAGLLSGLAFAVVYSVFGIPIGRFADRGRRVAVLTAALSIWSVMTAVCGLATGFVTMFLSRIGVGIGEAGGLPTTHALVAEYFPPERRSSALSAIAIAGAMGGTLGLMIGGLVAGAYGWRAAFWVGGAPGVAIALLVFLTIKEPSKRRLAEGQATSVAAQIPLGQALSILMRRTTFPLVIVGFAIVAIGSYAGQSWTPTFFMRSFGVSVAKIGIIYSLVTGLPALIGMLVGGILMDRWIRRDLNAYLWIMVLTFGLTIPFSLIIYFTHSLNVALGVTVVMSLMSSIYVGPMYALIQALAGSKLRATAAAVFMMAVNLVALSVGPWAAGFVSDLLAAQFGKESLRWSLCAMLLTYVVGLVFFLLALRTLKRDIAEAEKD